MRVAYISIYIYIHTHTYTALYKITCVCIYRHCALSAAWGLLFICLAQVWFMHWLGYIKITSIRV